MKKILSVLLLAAMALAMASCGGGTEPTATTTAGTTTAPAPQQTAAQTIPVTEDPNAVEEYPYIPGDPNQSLEALLDGKTMITDKVDQDSLRYLDFTPYNVDTESIAQMFDGVVDAEGFNAAGKGKIGGTLDANEEEGGGKFFFALTEAAKASAYVIVSGNDNASYPERNPMSWYLYATNDASVFEAETFDPSQWTVLDYVYSGNIAAGNWLESGYAIDEANQGEYQYYCYNCMYTTGGVFQIGEFQLYVG